METTEKKPRTQDPIRAAASVVANAKKKQAAVEARIERHRAELAKAEEALPAAVSAVELAQRALQEAVAGQ